MFVWNKSSTIELLEANKDKIDVVWEKKGKKEEGHTSVLNIL
jgi:hypothetical protein